ncbi:DUF748 domain-containing protein [Gracilimonas sp. BCB1]|uniref:DUF748 domain-containing protein n=1 Tax=Gracilimonas sp. BCB1 TaxID=3152362 RepID=UPI0032DC5816
MKDKRFKVFGGFLAVLIAGVLVLTLSLDGIMKSEIEENGSRLLQTQVTVENVNISPFTGSGSIEGFTVENPDKFSDQPAISIQEASIKVDLGTLLSDEIVVKNITVKSPQLYFEQQGFGANLKTLNDNMNLSSRSSSETALIIEHLLVESGEVTVSTDIDRKRTASATIESFELNGIGKDGSNTIQQSVQEVIKPLLEHAIAEAIKGGVVDQLENKVRNLLQN